MDLKEILTVSGKPGLYYYKAKSRHGIIIESLVDGTRTSIAVTTSVSPLSDISIYGEDGELPLRRVFTNMRLHHDEIQSLDLNDRDAVRELFAIVAPGYQEHRVYPTDMKKAFKWYRILDEAGITEYDEKPDGDSE